MEVVGPQKMTVAHPPSVHSLLITFKFQKFKMGCNKGKSCHFLSRFQVYNLGIGAFLSFRYTIHSHTFPYFYIIFLHHSPAPPHTPKLLPKLKRPDLFVLFIKLKYSICRVPEKETYERALFEFGTIKEKFIWVLNLLIDR